MPGSRTYTAGLDDRAQFRIIGDLESRWIPRKDKVVYFTDQSPTFEFEVENLTDNPLMIECTLYLSYQDDEILETKDFQIAVPPEGTERRDFNVDLLPYQGNVVIGLFGEFPNNGLTTSTDHFVVYTDHKSGEYIREIKDEYGFVHHLVREGSDKDPSADDDDEPSETKIPLYTFRVFDREYYSVNHVWPRRAQYLAAGLAVLIILVGILQILI